MVKHNTYTDKAEGIRMVVRTPLADAVEGYLDSERLSFHVPGHNRGKGLPAAYSQALERLGALADITELPGLDNLAAPADCIRQSQEEMARISGSMAAYYLVNGSTAGLEAAMLAMSGPGTPVILPAHCHTAIHNGLILTGSMPVILPCSMDLQWGLPLGVDTQAAGTWLGGKGAAKAGADTDEIPDKALWISVNPTYHGVMADLAWEQKAIEAQPGWLWLVDEAHGAHLPFIKYGIAEAQTNSALAFHADIVVQSAHKMGIALTQAGVLHCNRPELAGKLRQSLNIMQSSSPSYLLMASLDLWQAYLREDGSALLRRADNLALELAARVRAIDGYRLWQDELPEGYRTDPQKITISPRELGVDGHMLATVLRRDYRIDTELAAREYVLLALGLGIDEADISRMESALRDIRDTIGIKRKYREAAYEHGSFGSLRDIDTTQAAKEALSIIYRPGQKPWKPSITPREAFFAKREMIALAEAEGRFAAVSIVPYPPGIPAVYPGMEIQKEILEAVKAFAETESHCAGLVYEGDRLFIEVVSE